MGHNEEVLYKNARQGCTIIAQSGKVTISFGPHIDLDHLAFELISSVWSAIRRAFYLLHEHESPLRKKDDL